MCDVKAHDAEQQVRVCPGLRPRCSGQGVGWGEERWGRPLLSLGTLDIVKSSASLPILACRCAPWALMVWLDRTPKSSRGLLTASNK